MIKKLLVLVLSISFCLIIGYRIFNYGNNDSKNKVKVYISDIKENKKNINEKVSLRTLELNRSYFSKIASDSILNYRVTIDEENNLYIFDTDNQIAKQISDDKFVTLYVPDENNVDELFMAALNSLGNAYIISLKTTNIDDIEVKKIDTDYIITDFVENNDYSFNGIHNEAIYVKDINDNIYDLLTNSIYEYRMLNIKNMYTIYENGLIANNYGNLLYDKNGNSYVLDKYIILDDSSMFEGDPSAVIITKDKRILYSINNKLYVTNPIEFIYTSEYYSDMQFVGFSDNTKITLNGSLCFIEPVYEE